VVVARQSPRRGVGLYGALYAATSSDLKRLLAYSTTDNMGLVLIALGASGLFGAVGRPTTAAIAMVAALLLLINHSVFKEPSSSPRVRCRPPRGRGTWIDSEV